MLDKIDFKKVLPHILAVALFAILALVYFSPVLEGQRLKQSDIKQHKGMSQDIAEHREQFDEEPLWAGSLFSGMPAYQVSVVSKNPIIKQIDQVFRLWLPFPAAYVFLYMLGFYLMLVFMKIDPWLSIVGAIAFGFSSYFFVILEAGHNSKAHAIAYMAPVLGSILMALRGRYWLGGALTALFLSLEIAAGHLQVTYYLTFIIVAVLIAEFIDYLRKKHDWKQKQTIATYGVAALAVIGNLGYTIAAKATVGLVVMLGILILLVAYEFFMSWKRKTELTFFKGIAILGVAACIGVGANFTTLLTTYEYGKVTMRGAGELSIEPDGSEKPVQEQEGLDPYYITAWSYGKGETLTLFIPNAKGGASGYIGADNPALKKVDMASGLRNAIAEQSTYWGNQTFTSGPVYIGAIVLLLAFLGLIYLKGAMKWALLSVTIVTVLLSWGKNYMDFTLWFIDVVPGYGKFRAVTIILIVAEFCLPLMGVLWLKHLVDKREEVAKKPMGFYVGSGLTLLFLLVLVTVPEGMLNYQSGAEQASFKNAIAEAPDAQQAGSFVDYQQALIDVRIAIFTSDVWRSFMFVLLAVVAMLLFLRAKVSRYAFIAIIGVLILTDLWMVDKRYVNNEQVRGNYLAWEDKEDNKHPHAASQADVSVLQAEAQARPELSTLLQAAEQRAQQGKRDAGITPAALTRGEREAALFGELRSNTNFRVMNVAVSTFNDASTSYHFKSIGGYHGAKLKRYQDIVDFYLAQATGMIRANAAQGDGVVKQILSNQPVVNMLNTKYVITNPGAPAVVNPFAMGSAWFVGAAQYQANANEIIQALGTFDPKATAVLHERDQANVGDFTADPSATIDLTNYQSNHLTYLSNASSEQLAVFSEIYYNEDWQAYIDDQPVEHLQVNYLLRGLKIPAGEHRIEFKIESKSFKTGRTVTSISVIIMLLFIALGVYMARKQLADEPKTLANAQPSDKA
jgi:hypothetical protein